MKNLYVISNDDPIQLFYEIGMIKDGYDPSEMDDPLQVDLNDSDGKKRVEHRYDKRFQLKEDAFALVRSISSGPLKIHGKSMGCIACAVFNAKPVKLGRVDNISMGGLMFQHVGSKAHLSKGLVLDILLADCGFYLANMPFKIKADVVIPEDVPDDSIEMRQVRLQFQNLNANQQARLKDFILDHGVKIGEIGVNE